MSDKKINITGVAHSDDPREIIESVRVSMLEFMVAVLAGIKKDSGGPGMTWEQIEYFFEQMKHKKPKIDFVPNDREEH